MKLTHQGHWILMAEILHVIKGGYVCLKSEPIILESNQNHATITNSGVCPTLPSSMGMGGGNVPMVVEVYGVTTKGNGDAFVNADAHTSLSIGGGQAGQGYPCVLVVTENGTEDADRKEIL